MHPAGNPRRRRPAARLHRPTRGNHSLFEGGEFGVGHVAEPFRYRVSRKMQIQRLRWAEAPSRRYSASSRNTWLWSAPPRCRSPNQKTCGPRPPRFTIRLGYHLFRLHSGIGPTYFSPLGMSLTRCRLRAAIRSLARRMLSRLNTRRVLLSLPTHAAVNAKRSGFAPAYRREAVSQTGQG